MSVSAAGFRVDPALSGQFCLDLGNTRAKVTWVPSQGQPALLFADSCEALLAVLEGGQLPELTGKGVGPLLVCSVRAPGAVEALRGCLGAVAPETHLLEPAHGLALELSSAEGVGLDRLFAARGALELVQSPAVVVQVGTAVTVDAVSPGAQQGRFLGGSIAPGPDLLAQALHAGGARLPQVNPVPASPALGKDTEEALRGGIAVGLGGAVRALVEAVAQEAQLDEAQVVLTGGAREFVRSALAALDLPLIDDEHLVARGMAAGFAG